MSGVSEKKARNTPRSETKEFGGALFKRTATGAVDSRVTTALESLGIIRSGEFPKSQIIGAARTAQVVFWEGARWTSCRSVAVYAGVLAGVRLSWRGDVRHIPQRFIELIPIADEVTGVHT